MTPMFITSQKQQRGMSLISLMVGLVISLIILLATLIIFKNLTRTAISSKEDSKNDAQRLSSVLTGQILAQSAGFGISSAAVGTDLVLISGASLGTSNILSGSLVAVGGQGNAVVWGEKLDGATYQCEGLYSPSTGGMFRLGPVNCTSASAAWNTITWSTTTTLDNSSQSTSLMQFSEKTDGCASYGIVGTGKVNLTFTTTTVRRDLQQTNNPTISTMSSTSSSCLVNFPLT